MSGLIRVDSTRRLPFIITNIKIANVTKKLYPIFSKIALFDVTSLPILLDFSLTVKAATLIFISGCGSAISSAKEGKSGLIQNLVKS